MSRLPIKTILPIVACFSGFACSPAADGPSAPHASGGAHSSAGSAGTPTQGSAGTFTAGGASSSAAGTGSSGGDTSSSAGSGGSGGGAAAMCPPPQGAEAPLPLVVSANFVPSGYFAGPEENLKGIKEGTCENRPAAHKIGKCYKYTFQATALDPASAGAYGGVFWQYGANNWGNAPGMKVMPGATKVTFKAWSASAEGGEAVKFSAGGIGTAATLCSDGVNLGTAGGTTVTLTTTPTEYSIDLTGQSYAQGIIGGFVWSAAVTSLDDVVSFYVDEIQWTQ